MITRQDILILNAEYGDGTKEGVDKLAQVANNIPYNVSKDVVIQILKEVAKTI